MFSAMGKGGMKDSTAGRTTGSTTAGGGGGDSGSTCAST